MSGVQLLVSDSAGVFVPRQFAHSFDAAFWGIAENDGDWMTVMNGPDEEWYWDAWQSVLDRAFHVDPHGNKWHLWQDGDLFAYCEDKMTDDEYFSFYGHHRDSDLDNDEQSAWYDTSAELR